MRDPGRPRSLGVQFYLVAVTLIAALLLGGGTRAGFLSDAIVQLVALPLLLYSLWQVAWRPRSEVGVVPLVFCAAVVAVPLLQLMPLPPALWTHLPNRQAEVEALAALGRELPWMPLSVAPLATQLSWLSLIAPVGIYLGTSLLGCAERRILSLLVLAVGLFSVFVALGQFAQGPSSPLRFFDFSNDSVGFFANRNHYAALLYSVTLIAAAWAVDKTMHAGSRLTNRFDGATIVVVLAALTCLATLIGAQAMARSRAGLGLTIVALLGAFALSQSGPRNASGVTANRVLALSIGLGAMFAVQFALFRILDRFTSDPLQDGRLIFARVTAEAAKAFMPFGSGMGTFVPVYAQFERPVDVMANIYANRAHNDALELWLEAGVVGLALLAAFLAWYLWRCLVVWRPWPEGVEHIDISLARAASLVVGLLLVHSLVDYPLRTAAMMAVFAFACALIAGPFAVPGPAAVPERRPRAKFDPPDAIAAPAVAAQQLAQRWGENIEWPDAWRPTKNDEPGL